MKLGVVFPQTEIGSDPVVVRDYAQAVEGMGFDHLLAFEHVLGAHPERPEGWNARAYDYTSLFHEPMVLYGYLAGLTQRIELVTNVLILPQRQTALVAKQAAEVDVLSGGRLRLGVGLGWNYVEYEALGEEFTTRGRRVAEQIELMRALWTNEIVDFEGRWHRVNRAGIKPLPVQRPIPVWMGGGAEPVLKRIARYADGWFPQFPLDENAAGVIEHLHDLIREAGRNVDDVGIEGRVDFGRAGEEGVAPTLQTWQRLGASHVGLNTMRADLENPGEHLDAVRRFKEIADDLGVR